MTNATIVLREGEDAEQAVKRLKRALARNGTLVAMKRVEVALKPSERKKFKQKMARKRALKIQKRIAVAIAEREWRQYGTTE